MHLNCGRVDTWALVGSTPRLVSSQISSHLDGRLDSYPSVYQSVAATAVGIDRYIAITLAAEPCQIFHPFPRKSLTAGRGSGFTGAQDLIFLRASPGLDTPVPVLCLRRALLVV